MFISKIAGIPFTPWIAYIAALKYLGKFEGEGQIESSDRKKIQLIQEVLSELPPWYAKEAAIETVSQVVKEENGGG